MKNVNFDMKILKDYYSKLCYFKIIKKRTGGFMGSGMKPVLMKDFLKKTGFSLSDLGTVDPSCIKCVIGLREMQEIISINAMSKNYLNRLLDKIGTANSFSQKVYKGAKISFSKIDPPLLTVRSKICLP